MKIPNKFKICAVLAALAMPVAGHSQGGAPIPPPPPEPEGLPQMAKDRILERFDKDGDGYLNEEELAEAKRAVAERQAKIEEMQQRHAQRIIKEYDRDGDGKLSAEELIPLLEKHRRMYADLMEASGMAPRPGGHPGPGIHNPDDRRPVIRPGRGEGPREMREHRREHPPQRPERLRRSPITPDDLNELALPKNNG